ncbi:hypothetical protein C2R22_11120 [Salinigranum rubrum]|uniref:DUF4013 domain-containing protein n=1 Tax=Salinigranum rubrum TaxID=755307 RepID=A0A2I8VM17_9EURY|nr:DUF4013 domain-containing protein [Salinigranum rubrum]AUV82129.1 hypothetical protein C2R22_11120 [Salinigranum rubrum]
MLADSFRYPLRDGDARDATATCTGLVLVALLLLRAARALWPDLLALFPIVFALVPTVLFAGYLGRVVDTGGRPSSTPFSWSMRSVRLGVRVVVVAAVYLFPAALALALTAFVVLGGGGMLLTLAPTLALLVTVAACYLLPAAVAAAGRNGLRSGFRRASLGGLASGSYFFAWTVGTSLVVSTWSLLTAVRLATPAAVALSVVFAYVHVVAARLVGEGLDRSRWEPA